MNDVVIIGIGNVYRGDDAAGWAVIEGISKKIQEGVKLIKSRGDIAELIDFFSLYRVVYLVDACESGSASGKWRRIDLHIQALPEENLQTSTHGFSISQSINLAANIGRLPEKLVLYAIEGKKYQMSEELSPAMAEAVEIVINEILNEEDVQSCMNKA